MHSDFRLALRQLLKSPGFTTIAVLTLAFGIGLNTSMFSLMNLLVLQPLPFPDKDHLVRIYRTTPQSQTADHSATDFLDIGQGVHEFADLAAFRMWSFNLAPVGRPPVNLNSLRVSGNFFAILGIQPELGRVFTADEDRPGNHVMIISHAAWLAQFGGDPAIIGRTVRIDGEGTTIVGVMPATFASVFLWGPGDAFRPLALTDTEKTSRDDASLRLVARFHGAASLDELNARLATLAARLAPQRPRADSSDGLHAVTLQSIVQNRNTLQGMLLLLGLAGFVLLIACANLANLQLARAVTRTREFAIRAALGANRRRLLGPLLVESLLLALVGGGFGILVAAWSNDWLSSRLSANGMVSFNLVIDWRVLGFALLTSLVTGLVFGIAPAWMMARVNVNETLKSGARGSTGDRAQHRLRHALIVTQFALALVLLAGAGFFISGLDRILSQDTGWNTSNMVQGVLNLPQAKYSTPAQTYAFYSRLEERLGALPGVEHVTVAWTLPLFQFLASRPVVVEGRDAPPAGHEPTAAVNGVTPSFLDTLQIKLLAGRNFSAADNPSGPPVVLINDALAQALFPHENPIGRRIGSADAANRNWMEIVGVVSDVHFAVGFTPPATPFLILRPLAQETWNYVTVALRSPSSDNLVEPVRQVIAQLDPDLPVQLLGTVQHTITLFTSGTLMINTVLVVFAGLGLFLAALGLYGVIARLVVQRTPEIGVRIALGARPRDVGWLILGSGIRLTLLGTGFGLLGAWGLGRVIALISPAMGTHDFTPVILVTLLLLGVALLACWIPTRRAMRVDPMTALRTE